MNYLQKFVGMKYTKYNCLNTTMDEEEPFWVSNTELPAFSYIYERGSTCVGLINILRRRLRLEIPGIINGEKKHNYPGGTGAWFNYLKDKNRLLKIDVLEEYPKGTLLLQDFNFKDQGHVAVVINDNINLLESDIIHNINGIFNKKIYNGVIIEKLMDFPCYERFTHICLPENWLLKN